MASPRTLPGSDDRTRAIALAGWLADRSIQSITLRAGGVDRRLNARSTDLPGELMRTIEASLGEGVVVLGPDGAVLAEVTRGGGARGGWMVWEA